MSTNQPQPSDTPAAKEVTFTDIEQMTLEQLSNFIARYNTLERENAAQDEKYQAAYFAWREEAAAQAKRIAELEADKRRLDWLADKTNDVGQVLLPSDCVNAHLDDMRAAIDAAMETRP